MVGTIIPILQILRFREGRNPSSEVTQQVSRDEKEGRLPVQQQVMVRARERGGAGGSV